MKPMRPAVQAAVNGPIAGWCGGTAFSQALDGHLWLALINAAFAAANAFFVVRAVRRERATGFAP